MREQYSVLWNGREVGLARIQRQGLYCHIQCEFVAQIGEMYVLYAQTGDESQRLGVPILCGNAFVLNTRIPIKRFPQNIQGIYVIRKQDEGVSAECLLVEGKAVSDLRHLMEKKLNFTEGGVFLIDTCINRHK